MLFVKVRLRRWGPWRERKLRARPMRSSSSSSQDQSQVSSVFDTRRQATMPRAMPHRQTVSETCIIAMKLRGWESIDWRSSLHTVLMAWLRTGLPGLRQTCHWSSKRSDTQVKYLPALLIYIRERTCQTLLVYSQFHWMLCSFRAGVEQEAMVVR